MAKEPQKEKGTVAAPAKEKKPHNHLLYVSWTFIFIGILALMQTVQSVVNNPPAVPNFLMVFMVVGWGLLKRKPLWRTFALSCAYVFTVFTIGQVIMVVRNGYGFPSTTDAALFWALSVVMITAGGYAIWALQTKSVRDQFEPLR